MSATDHLKPIDSTYREVRMSSLQTTEPVTIVVTTWKVIAHREACRGVKEIDGKLIPFDCYWTEQAEMVKQHKLPCPDNIYWAYLNGEDVQERIEEIANGEKEA